MVVKLGAKGMTIREFCRTEIQFFFIFLLRKKGEIHLNLAYQLEGGSICIAWPFCQIINLTHILRSRSSLHPPRHV